MTEPPIGNPVIHLTTVIPQHLHHRRLDQALAELFPDYSRSRLQRWIKQGKVTVDGTPSLQQTARLMGGEQIEILAQTESEVAAQPQAIPLSILYEDESLLVINKPVGLVVHPAAGNPDGTLQNALLHHDPTLAAIPRAGIVHRLDKDTSGLLVIARTLAAHHSLTTQLHDRQVTREYRALAQGLITAGGRIDRPIGRHPIHRVKMAVVEGGRRAVTHYRVLERFRAHSYLKINLETGRTHQIRVHMASIHHPLAGDPLYGGRLRLPAGASEPFSTLLRTLNHQALHAHRLRLIHPGSGEPQEWVAPIPETLQQLLLAAARDAQDG